MEKFLETFGLSSLLIHEKTCEVTNKSLVDLFLTNSRNSFKYSILISAGLSDFHEMILTDINYLSGLQKFRSPSI